MVLLGDDRIAMRSYEVPQVVCASKQPEILETCESDFPLIQADREDAAIAVLVDEAISRRSGIKLRYRCGSPFLDIRLPCKGGMEVLIVPQTDPITIVDAANRLARRGTAGVVFTPDCRVVPLDGEDGITLLIRPQVLLLVFGQGPEASCFASLARHASFPVELHSSDVEMIGVAGFGEELVSPGWSRNLAVNERTAIVSFFHVHDWETEVLQVALGSPAFFVGAQGSLRAQVSLRCPSRARNEWPGGQWPSSLLLDSFPSHGMPERWRFRSCPSSRACKQTHAVIVAHAEERPRVLGSTPQRTVNTQTGIGKMELGIAGKNAIVCASSKGLGRACAVALAQEGVNVVVSGRNADAVSETTDYICGLGRGAAIGVVGDVTTADGRKALLAACPEPDILINNSGGPAPKMFDQTSEEDWRDVVERNMLSPLFLTQSVLPGMIRRKFGRVINITSAVVATPRPHMTMSAAPRAGLTAAMKAISLDVARYNVTINNLLPERIDTDRQHYMAQQTAERENISYDEARHRQVASIAANRLGKPEEFGAVCAFHCSDLTGFMSGQNIHLDGGSYPALF